METVLKVKALSKFGFFVEGEEKGIYFDRSLLEVERGKFVPGAEIPVCLRVAESGTKYVTGIRESPPSIADAPRQPVVPSRIAENVKVVKNETMTKAEWGAKDRSMMVGGLFHDAAALTAAAVTANVPVAEVQRIFVEMAEWLIKQRDAVK